MAIFQFNNCTIRPQTCQCVKSFIKGRKLAVCIITGINADFFLIFFFTQSVVASAFTTEYHWDYFKQAKYQIALLSLLQNNLFSIDKNK